MARSRKPPTQTITCPDCGLVLRSSDHARVFKIVYDEREWRRICGRVYLGNAAWCLIQRDGTYKLSLAKITHDESHFDSCSVRGASD
jgi:hypothetical protein